MIVNVYGVQSEKVVRWFLQSHPNIGVWVDLGCGNGEYLEAINFKPRVGVGVDVARPKNLPPNFRFEKNEINRWLDINQGRFFDLISMFDVVEHFPKEEALKLIDRAKHLAENLIISTPSGFLRQDAKTHPEEKDNPWQWHKCGFEPEEFEELGFLVFVLKNYHYKPPGNDKTFDKLVCFWSTNPSSYSSLARSVRIKTLIYILWPLHFYRMIRNVFVRPLS
jgi:hypothetical protein